MAGTPVRVTIVSIDGSAQIVPCSSADPAQIIGATGPWISGTATSNAPIVSMSYQLDGDGLDQAIDLTAATLPNWTFSLPQQPPPAGIDVGDNDPHTITVFARDSNSRGNSACAKIQVTPARQV